MKFVQRGSRYAHVKMMADISHIIDEDQILNTHAEAFYSV